MFEENNLIETERKFNMMHNDYGGTISNFDNDFLKNKVYKDVTDLVMDLKFYIKDRTNPSANSQILEGKCIIQDDGTVLGFTTDPSQLALNQDVHSYSSTDKFRTFAGFCDKSRGMFSFIMLPDEKFLEPSNCLTANLYTMSTVRPGIYLGKFGDKYDIALKTVSTYDDNMDFDKYIENTVKYFYAPYKVITRNILNSYLKADRKFYPYLYINRTHDLEAGKKQIDSALQLYPNEQTQNIARHEPEIEWAKVFYSMEKEQVQETGDFLNQNQAVFQTYYLLFRDIDKPITENDKFYIFTYNQDSNGKIEQKTGFMKFSNDSILDEGRVLGILIDNYDSQEKAYSFITGRNIPRKGLDLDVCANDYSNPKKLSKITLAYNQISQTLLKGKDDKGDVSMSLTGFNPTDGDIDLFKSVLNGAYLNTEDFNDFIKNVLKEQNIDFINDMYNKKKGFSQFGKAY